MTARRIQTALALIALVLSLGVIFTSSPAKADVGLLACRVQNGIETPHLRVQLGGTPSSNLYFFSSDHRWVPGSSSCNDINVSWMTENYSPWPGACRYMRVRLFATSGNVITGNWVYHCHSNSLKVLMYGVLNGTEYEIHQYMPGQPCCPQRVRMTVTD